MQWGRQMVRYTELFKSITFPLMRELIILLLVCFLASISNAQEDTVETKFKVFPLPVAYFTPETH